MDFFSFVFFLVVAAIIVCIVLVCMSDADLSLRWCETFGSGKLAQFRTQVVWVTGASGGIGAAIAKEAAKNGARVVLSARNKEALQEVKRECVEYGRHFGLTEDDYLVLPMDVCQFDEHQKCVDAVIKKFGKISTIMLNAGRSQRGRWDRTSLGVDRELFELNVFSTVNLARIVVPVMEARQGGGSVVVVTSVAGKAGVPFSGTYSGTKFALHGYFESLRLEKVGTGINITLVCPGPVFSNILHAAATEKPGEHYGGRHSALDRRVTAERCAYLTLMATAHKLEEVWIALFPVLPIVYFNQYMPTASKRLVNYLGAEMIKKQVQKLRDNQETVRN